MPANNEIFPFGIANGATVITPDAWEVLPSRLTGFQDGILPATYLNTALRQALFSSSMIAQFTADYSGMDVLDDGNVAGFVTKFAAALVEGVGAHVIHVGFDTGTQNNIVVNTTPTTTLNGNPVILVKTLYANTAPVTMNVDGTGARNVVNTDGSSLATGQLVPGGWAWMMYDGPDWQLIANRAMPFSPTWEGDHLLPGQLPPFGLQRWFAFDRPGAHTFTVPGDIYSLRIRGWGAGAIPTVNGGDTIIAGLMTCKGGQRSTTTAGGLGGTGGSGGSVAFPGGNGGNGINGTFFVGSGGGGGAAGTILGPGGAGGDSTAFTSAGSYGGGGGAPGGHRGVARWAASPFSDAWGTPSNGGHGRDYWGYSNDSANATYVPADLKGDARFTTRFAGDVFWGAGGAGQPGAGGTGYASGFGTNVITPAGDCAGGGGRGISAFDNVWIPGGRCGGGASGINNASNSTATGGCGGGEFRMGIFPVVPGQVLSLTVGGNGTTSFNEETAMAPYGVGQIVIEC